MSCDRCGRHTPRRRLCKLCQLDDRAEERDTEARLFECPDCGVERTSGRGVTCSVCRSDSQ